MNCKTSLKIVMSSLLIIISLSVHGQENNKKKNKRNLTEERASINKMTNKALSQLYKINPQAKTEIANSKGYAVFSNSGVNLLLLSTANGAGKAVGGGKTTYMKMFSGGVGVGLGIKKFYGIFIFNTTKAYNNFVEYGWQAGGQADVAAKDNNQGGSIEGAISISPDISYYQVTKKGLAAQITVQGTKYWKDKELN